MEVYLQAVFVLEKDIQHLRVHIPRFLMVVLMKKGKALMILQ